MIEIFMMYLISLIFKKTPEVTLLPDDFVVVYDSDDDNLDLSDVDLYQLIGPRLYISGDELLVQIEDSKLLGQKSLNFYFKHQEKIPEKFKIKTNLFVGTIYINKNGTRFVPSLYFLPFQSVWVKSFFCLSDQVSLRHNCVPVKTGDISKK